MKLDLDKENNKESRELKIKLNMNTGRSVSFIGPKRHIIKVLFPPQYICLEKGFV